jgi:thiol:disulfide interchange protein DsbD
VEADVVNDYAKAMQLSQAQHKPLLIDFTGWACVNCRKMEEEVWTKPGIHSFIKQNFILVSLYVDDRKRLPAQQRFTYITSAGTKKEIITQGDQWATFESENFGQQTQPLYVLINNDGKIINDPVGYTPDASTYLKWLQCGASNATYHH